MVTSNKAERGEKEIKTNWPVEEGTDFGTTKQTGDRYLVPEESKVLSRNTKLI
ncbi:MAG: hypothetical protein GWP19_00305 [Planctomycetia bacterium]|nr:hypothetical protein [Planctomycetia bacterium]